MPRGPAVHSDGFNTENLPFGRTTLCSPCKGTGRIRVYATNGSTPTFKYTNCMACDGQGYHTL